MNERQKRFAEYYAESGNAYLSAVKAGYSENYARARGSELLENSEVADHIKSITQKARKKRIIDALQRQEILSEIASDSREETDSRIRAIDTLNKMTGEYTQKVSLDGDKGVVIIDDIKRSSD